MKLCKNIFYSVIAILIISTLIKLFSGKKEKCSFYENFNTSPVNVTYIITDENKGEYILLDNISMKYNIIYFNKNKTKEPWKIYNYDNNSNRYGGPKGEVSYNFMNTISGIYYNSNIKTPSNRVSLSSNKIYIFRENNNNNNIIIPQDIIGNNNWKNVEMLNNGENNLWNILISFDNSNPVPLLINTGAGLNPDDYRIKKGNVYIISKRNVEDYVVFKKNQDYVAFKKKYILNIFNNNKNIDLSPKIINKKQDIDNVILSKLKNYTNINLDNTYKSYNNTNYTLTPEQKANLLSKNITLNNIILGELFKQDSSLSGKTQDQQYLLLSSFFDNDKQLAKTINDMSPDIPIQL